MNTKKKKIIIISVTMVLLAALLVTVTVFTVTHIKAKRRNEEHLREVEEYYAAKYELYEKENLEYEDYEVDVAFLGDSLTDGYDVKRFYPDLTVSNRGIGGETTVGLEERLPLSVYELCPKVAVLLIGANNMQTMLDNYEDILAGLKENLPNTKVAVISLTSMSGEWGKKNHLAAYNNVTIKLLAEEYGYEYVDMYSALFNIETGEIHAEYTTDGGHLTEDGYEVFTQTLRPYIDKLLLAYGEEVAPS